MYKMFNSVRTLNKNTVKHLMRKTFDSVADISFFIILFLLFDIDLKQKMEVEVARSARENVLNFYERP